jgi:hypothetical protein
MSSGGSYSNISRADSGVPSSTHLYEVIGAYFATCFWSNLYKAAQEDVRQKRFDSLEQAYGTCMERYVQSIRVGKNPEGGGTVFDVIFGDLYKNYKTYLAQDATVNSFIDICARYFSPADTYAKMTETSPQKKEIIQKVITRTLVLYAAWIQGTQMPVVLDSKNRTAANGTAWKVHFILILKEEINKLCSIIIAGANGIRMTENTSSVPKEVLDKALERIKCLLQECAELTKERNEMAKIAEEHRKLTQQLIEDKKELIARLTTQPRQQVRAQRQDAPMAAAATSMPVLTTAQIPQLMQTQPVAMAAPAAQVPPPQSYSPTDLSAEQLTDMDDWADSDMPADD